MLRVALFLLCLAPAAALAQVPTDTIPRQAPTDTAVIQIPPEGIVPDTLPADSLRPEDPDSMRQAPHIPFYPDPYQASWGFARWEWDRADLQRFNALSLLELLERVPGIVSTSAGGFGHPSGVTAMGQGGGRLRVFRDGFELDPLNHASYDLQQIGLLDLDLVRVERTLVDTRIHLRTHRLADRRPFSEIEIGTGNYQARFLRALFARPVGSRSVLSGAYDLTSADGYFHQEPFSFSSGRIRWDYQLLESTGVRLELRQVGVSRESELYPADFDRRELVARVRAQPLSGLTVEALAGRTLHRPVGVDRDSLGTPIQVGEASDTLDVDRSTVQAQLRAMYVRNFGYLEAVAKLRTGDTFAFGGPERDFSVHSGLDLGRWLSLEGEARNATWDGAGATELRLAARTAPVLGFSAFGSISAGERIVQSRRDTIFTVTDTLIVDEVETIRQREIRDVRYFDTVADIGGLRVGAEWSGFGTRLGVAALSANATEVVPFSAGFDRGLPVMSTDAAQGVEGFAAIALPSPFRGLRLDGAYTHWMEGAESRPYMPADQGRVALIYHDIRQGGQFEPSVRLEAVHRGVARVPDGTGAYVSTEPYTMLNFHLQLRIVDVRAFFTYQNLLNETEAFDLPNRNLPGPRTMYGVRWFFRN